MELSFISKFFLAQTAVSAALDAAEVAIKLSRPRHFMEYFTEDAQRVLIWAAQNRNVNLFSAQYRAAFQNASDWDVLQAYSEIVHTVDP